MSRQPTVFTGEAGRGSFSTGEDAISVCLNPLGLWPVSGRLHLILIQLENIC